MPTMTEVQSSNVHSIGFDEADGSLHVRFKDKAGTPSKVYRHPGVPRELHETLMAADSIGGFYAKHIRKQFKGEPIDTTDA